MSYFKGIGVAVLILFIIHENVVFSQVSDVSVRSYGIVLDAETNEPLPFAHVKLQGSTYGTITNGDGQFSLPLTKDIEVILEITMVGYQTKIINYGRLLKDQYVRAVLKPHEKLLNEVVVKPKDYELKLLRAAINNIPMNYPDKPEMLRFFTRNQAQKDENHPYYIIEMSGRAAKQAYDNRIIRGDIEILESQKIEFQSLDSLGVRFYAGGHVAHWADLVATRSAVLDLNELEHFYLDLTDTIPTDRGAVYVIDFSPKDFSKVAGTGRIFIEENSYAIVKMSIRYTSGNFGHLYGLDRVSHGYSRIYRDKEASYSFSEGVWRLNRAKYETAFEKDGEKVVTLQDDLLITGLDSIDQIDYLNQLHYRDIVLHKVNAYDSNYWKNQSVILPDLELKHAVTQEKIRDTDARMPIEKLFSILGKFEEEFGLGGAQVHLKNTDVTYGEMKFHMRDQEKWILTNSWCVSYRLNKALYASLEGASSFYVKNYYGSMLIGLGNSVNLNPKGRPIRLNSSVLFGYVGLGQRLGSVSQEDYLGKASEKFDADQADIYLRQLSFVTSPSIRLSIDKSPHFGFRVGVAHPFLFYPSQRIVMREDELFLTRKHVTLRNGADDTSISGTSDFSFQAGWQVGVSLIYRPLGIID